MRYLPVFATTVGLLAAASSHAAPVFNLTYIAGTSAQAQAAFQRAANYWSSALADTVAIDLTVGTGALGGGILASTSTADSSFAYGAFRSAIAANTTSALDAAAVAGLPHASPIPIYINRTADNPNGSGSSTPYVDTLGGNNTSILVTNADAKALGLSPVSQIAPGCSSNCDGFIEFSTSFSYDFDRSNGISGGLFDFVGLAIHEIGHALGFISGVDILDENSPSGGPFFAADAFAFVTPLDMFRCSTASATAGASIDFTADNRAKSFSTDDCATTLGSFATGRVHGDGRQASHWKDNLGLGVMDPTAGGSEFLTVTPLDLMAFDAIGWEIQAVAEPGTLLLGSAWLGAVAVVRRRARR